MNLPYHAVLLSLVVSPSVAQSDTWFAAPLDTATVAVTGLLAVLPIPEFFIAFSFLFRGRWPIRTFHYQTGHGIYQLGLRAFRVSSLRDLLAAFFADLSDVLVFLAIALVIRVRYFAYKGYSWDETKSSLPLAIMMSFIGLMSLLVFAMVSAYAGLGLHPQLEFGDPVASFHYVEQPSDQRLLQTQAVYSAPVTHTVYTKSSSS
ncbi:hypothetical protein M422DRAFT_256859 [Sphaerobolus stellatus SS14]|uniref:Uncharacterized protein n=1 Tax=Sphaerobolus stellatus (strain SS14) TaxID=990650 RepID=A0A0C9UZM1_SPHS4|nr:hypothetical protein M422DRAFT_256859 [Sphaerobolus stellatus SS14]